MRTVDALFDEDLPAAAESVAEARRRAARAHRREYRYALAAGVFAVWATIASFAAWHFYQERDHARDAGARDALARAVDTLDRVVARVAGDISALPDEPPAPLAATLAAIERDYVDALADEAAPPDADRQRRAADLFIVLSGAYLAVDQARRAAAAAGTARSVLEQLDDGRPEDRGRLAAAHLAEGDALVAMGEFDAAATAFGEAVAIHGALSAAVPDDPVMLRTLSIAFEREGQAHDRLGQWSQAAGRFHQALAIRSQLAATGAGGDAELLEPLAIAHSNLGDHAMRAGSPDSAVDHYQRALAVFERLAEFEPDNLDWVEAITIHRARQGRAYVAAGVPSAGLDLLDEAAEALHALVERNPRQQRWQLRLAEVLGWAGAVRLGRYDYPGARAAYTRALDLRRHHAERDPVDTRLVTAFADTLLRLAEIDRGEGLDEMARLRVGEAIDLRRRVWKVDPDAVAAATALAEALAAGADIGLTPRAHLEEALDVLARFAENDQLYKEHEPLAENLRQRLASLTQ